jgi:hypothetical protein
MSGKRKFKSYNDLKRWQNEYGGKRVSESMRESAERRRYGGKTQAERYEQAMAEKRSQG